MSNTFCRGIRGATTADANTREAILGATEDLLLQIVEANHISEDDVAAIFFTTTRDLNAEFPALAARQMGWVNSALLCGHEMDVPDGTQSIVRILMLVNTSKKPDELVHLYLKGAENLRNRGVAAWKPS